MYCIGSHPGPRVIESTIIIVTNSSYVTTTAAINISAVQSRTWIVDDTWLNEIHDDMFSISCRYPGPRKPKPPPQRAAVAPWLPKLVLRVPDAPWACLLRAFSGR